MAAHSSILAWEILWTEDPGGLQAMGSQRVRLDLATEHASTRATFQQAMQTVKAWVTLLTCRNSSLYLFSSCSVVILILLKSP